jgi:hypothetical protein
MARLTLRINNIWTPYPEWWRDRPFEATATGSIRNAGAKSHPLTRGKDKVRSLKPLLILEKRFFFGSELNSDYSPDHGSD